jgi:DNA polymerase-1
LKVVLDIEANGLKPTQIWLIVCKDIDTGEYYTFRNLTTNDAERTRFLEFSSSVELFIGHNILGYDGLVIDRLLGIKIYDRCLDTFILSKLIDFGRKGHSLDDYGNEFGVPKGIFKEWTSNDLYDNSSELFLALEVYCRQDVEINHKVYLKYLKYLSNPLHTLSINLEHSFSTLVINTLRTNGFKFNVEKARDLLKKVELDLSVLDKDIEVAFPPKEVVVREFIPKATKFGTISKSSVPVYLRDRIHEFEVGQVYKQTKLVPFNPSSHKQIIAVLNEAGWQPVEKTQAHIDLEREVNRQKYRPVSDRSFDLAAESAKLEKARESGWKVSEANLLTLPDNAPAAARSLAKRILLEARRRTLTEWLSLVEDDGRIHGEFQGIGTWTHRMATQKPNMQNIPNEFDTEGRVKPLGKEMRQIWCAPKNRLLVGVDAEGIQLRIFAHYINDPEFTRALVEGKKDDKTDPHSLNQRIIGDVCKSRAAAKRFIYALLLGAGNQKLSAILGCSDRETKEALDRLLARYSGWAKFKEEIIPKDAARGYLIGLDGRKVRIPGDTESSRKHLAMSGYLQNGEAVCMKMATLKWMADLEELKKEYPKLDYKLVNFVHDEWQTEVNNNFELAIRVAQVQCDALRYVGEELKLNCPLAGSYWNDDHHEHTIGTNWYRTH